MQPVTTSKIEIYVKNFSSQLISNVLSQLIGLAVVPFSARVLGLSKFGEYNLANSFFVYASMFATFGFGLYLAREVPRRDDISRVVNFSVTIRVLISVLVAILLIGVAYKTGVSDQFTLLNIVFASVLLISSVDLRWVFIAKDLMWRISVLNLLGQIISAVLIFSILNNSSQIILFALCQNVVLVLPSLVSLWMYRKSFGRISFTLSYDKWEEFRKESLHFGLISLLATINVQIGTIWLGFLLTTDEVGIYSAGFRLMMFFNMVFNLSSSVIAPSISRIFVLQRDKLISLLNAYFAFSIVLGITAAITLYYVAGPLISILFGESYEKASGLMRIWAIGMLPFTPLSIFSISTMMATNATKHAFKIILMGSVILLSILPLLIGYFGTSGVAIGQAVMEIMVSFISFFYLVRVLQLNRIEILRLINMKNAFYFGLDLLKARFNNK